jgi:integrase
MALHALLNDKRVADVMPTLEDAKRLYIREKLKGGLAGVQKKTADRVIRLVGVAHDTLGTHLPLSEIGREGAKQVRDAIADSMKSDGKAVAPATVKRNLSTVKAVISYAITELELMSRVSNPFNKLPINGLEEDDAESEKRNSFPVPMLLEVRRVVLSSSNPELCLIWRLLEGTGCRGAEITGLRVEDVKVEGETPHIVVTWHETRRVKSKASQRHVPLYGDALDAAKEALSLSRKGNMLFPKYGREGGPDAASAALMKHVRRATTDKLLVVNSLRHGMKDWLRLAEVAPLDQNLILGHALGGVGDRVYGGAPAKLRITTEAMRRAYHVKMREEKNAKARGA